MVMHRRRFLVSAATFLGTLGAPCTSIAQAPSSRPIRVIIPFAAGGGTDAYARLVSEHMSKTLGRILIVEHKPGRSGNIGTQFVAEAPADGETILLSTQSLSEIAPSAFSNLKWSLSDFVPLIRGVSAPLVLVSNPAVPVTTLPELVEWLRKNPGKHSYSSYSSGSPSHFLGYQLNERFRLDLGHVPSKGSGYQATDLMGGHVLFGFAQMHGARPLIQAGKLNAIAITDSRRSRFLPSVPTFAELGHDEFTTGIWFGLMVRTGTPPAVVERILAAAKAAHADPDIRAKLESQGLEISGQSGPEFAADIKAQIERWARLVRAAGFSAN